MRSTLTVLVPSIFAGARLNDQHGMNQEHGTQSLSHAVTNTAGPLGIAEIRSSELLGFFGFYKDWTVVRITILNQSSIAQRSPTGSLSYSIDYGWDLKSMSASGAEDCSVVNTGGVFDPTLACHGMSGNELCIGLGACSALPGSSANKDAMGTYRCNPDAYGKDPYTCAVGDLSGKYGLLSFGEGHPKMKGEARGESESEPSLADLLRYALVDVSEEGANVKAESSHLKPMVQLSNGNNVVFEAQRDRYAAPVSLLRGRSVVVRGDNGEAVACGRIQYAADVPQEIARAEVLARLGRQRGQGMVKERARTNDAINGWMKSVRNLVGNSAIKDFLWI